MATQNSYSVSRNVVDVNGSGYFGRVGVTSNAGYLTLERNLLHLLIVGNFVQMSFFLSNEKQNQLQTQSK